MEHNVSFDCSGKSMSISTGKMAKQADGAVTVRIGDTIVISCVVAATTAREGIDFFPLTVDYREKVSAIGRFPGGYIKREGRPTEKEILTSRLTDRPIRPLFPEDYRYEVQVINSVLSADDDNDPDILSIIGASAALHISDIPFHGPVGAVRVGLVDGNFVINPTYEQLKTSQIDIIVAAKEKGLVMVEGSAKIVSEDKLFEALMAGFNAAQAVIKAQNVLREKAGKEKRDYDSTPVIDEATAARLKELVLPGLGDAIKVKDKKGRSDALRDLFNASLQKIKEENEDVDEKLVVNCFNDLKKEKARDIILNENVRADGRGFTDIRNITSEIGILPRTHGSALFTRGETQALVMVTLGGAGDTQRSESYEGVLENTFMLHYNFPPFSVGEVKPQRGPGRREIGHGKLAERALSAVLPESEKFPYTIRLVSDILESNGSSSMASVCGGSLSLMDAGVPVKDAVAGIAMGMIVEGDRKAVLSDILGQEDHLGDMDFKVAGTKDGITAIQMDLKVESVEAETLKQALNQAKEGRLHILGEMAKTISEPCAKLSQYAPKIATVTIPKEKIGLVIGPGGSNIKKLIEIYSVEININDDGLVSVYSTDEENIKKAVEHVSNMVAEIEVGKIYYSTVKKIVDFGAFVEVLPGKEGLIHISRISNQRIGRVEDVMKVGDQFHVKCIDIDDKGRCVLSKKDADNDMAKDKEPEKKEE